MKVKYFEDTDTLYIEFRADAIVESRDLDENTLLELDVEGRVCAMTMEHASQRMDAKHFSFEQVAA
jgi:uncharacterized protein YuzE